MTARFHCFQCMLWSFAINVPTACNSGCRACAVSKIPHLIRTAYSECPWGGLWEASRQRYTVMGDTDMPRQVVTRHKTPKHGTMTVFVFQTAARQHGNTAPGRWRARWGVVKCGEGRQWRHPGRRFWAGGAAADAPLTLLMYCHIGHADSQHLCTAAIHGCTFRRVGGVDWGSCCRCNNKHGST